MAPEVRALNQGELRFIMDGGKPRIDGRAILFNSWSVDLGGFRERMVPGSVQLDGDLVALFDHATDKVLGRLSAGTMEVRPDDRGVAFTAYPPETTWANDLRVSMERGDIRGCSYRMMVDEDRWYVENGQVCRDVLKARISELTVTSMPAYPETTAEARSQAQALAQAAKVEDRVGRVLSDANEQVLVQALNNIELAGDAIAAVIKTVNPSFDEDNLDAENSDVEDSSHDMTGTPDAGRTPGSEILAPAGAADGEEDRSSDGASETHNPAPVYVPGFGFIPNKERR